MNRVVRTEREEGVGFRLSERSLRPLIHLCAPTDWYLALLTSSQGVYFQSLDTELGTEHQAVYAYRGLIAPIATGS